MAPQEKTEIIQHLERSRDEFLAALAGVSEEQARLRTDPERWSVLDCVEHVAFVENRFLGWLRDAKKLDAPQVDKAKEAGLATRVPDRSTRVKAPEAAVPNGRFETLDQALAEFNAARVRSIGIATEQGDALYLLATEHPRFGPVNGMELMIIMAGHARRHAEQIRETRAALGHAAAQA
jgi:DinB superfamily